jgi:integral membrane protein
MKNPQEHKDISSLKKIGFIEGISYLLLIGVAMPLKYMAGLKIAVTLAGTLHGILFLAFVVAILQAMVRAGLKPLNAFICFVASLIPFATFYMDRYAVSGKNTDKNQA